MASPWLYWLRWGPEMAQAPVRSGRPARPGRPSAFLLDRLAASLQQLGLEGFDRLLDRREIGVHGQRLLEVLHRAAGLVQLDVDHAVAGQRSPVIRIARQHLVAVGQRLAVLAEDEVDG